MKLQLMVRAKHLCGTHLAQIQFTRFTCFSEGGGIYKSNRAAIFILLCRNIKTLQLSRVVSITIKFSVTPPQLINVNYRVFTSCFNRPELILTIFSAACHYLQSSFIFLRFQHIFWNGLSNILTCRASVYIHINSIIS